MNEEPPPLIDPELADPVEPSLADDLQQLVDDGRTLVAAELAYQKSRAIAAGSGIASIAAWAVAGFILFLLTVITALFGAVLELSGPFGPAGATLIIVVVMLVLTTLCALMVQRKWKRIDRIIGGGGGGDA